MNCEVAIFKGIVVGLDIDPLSVNGIDIFANAKDLTGTYKSQLFLPQIMFCKFSFLNYLINIKIKLGQYVQ